MGLKAKQKRISGEKLTFSFFQGVVFQWDFSQIRSSSLNLIIFRCSTFLEVYPTDFFLKIRLLSEKKVKSYSPNTTTGSQRFPLTTLWKLRRGRNFKIEISTKFDFSSLLHELLDGRYQKRHENDLQIIFWILGCICKKRK